jgi:hypothetical protein
MTTDLQHYGVKGMKWGVRRSDAQLARARKQREKDNRSGDRKTVDKSLTKAKSSGVSSLSNKQLKQVNSRLELERKYNQLNTKENPVDRGLKSVKKVLAVGAAVNAAIAFSKSPAGQAVASGIRQAAASAASNSASTTREIIDLRS